MSYQRYRRNTKIPNLYDGVPTTLSKDHKAYHHERDMGYYCRSMWSELVVPHEDGIITCEVQDQRGSYRHTPEQNMPMLQSEEGPNHINNIPQMKWEDQLVGSTNVYHVIKKQNLHCIS